MADDVHSKLTEEIRQHLPQSDLPTIEIVTAVAGLLATVASADRRLEVIEKQQLLAKLELIQGLRGAPAQAILQFLEANLIEISTIYVQRFTRSLVEYAPEQTRMEVLEALLEIAAADGKITLSERRVVRNLTNALGLTQDHYNQLQNQYRSLLET